MDSEVQESKPKLQLLKFPAPKPPEPPAAQPTSADYLREVLEKAEDISHIVMVYATKKDGDLCWVGNVSTSDMITMMEKAKIHSLYQKPIKPLLA